MFVTRRACWLVVSLATLVAPVAQAAITKVVTLEGITEYRLDNGVQLLLYPDASRPTVTVNMTVLVGSRHEGYGEAGMAHLLEHMVFKGTPGHAQIPAELREHGASFNGSTSNDRTNYYETLPATEANLEWAIEMEADRLVNSFVKGEDLASEMTVVRNEFERSENSPGGLLNNRVMAAAFDWHNYGKSTIGNRTDIERVPINKLQDFYRRFYQPDNIMLVVAGKFDEAKTLALVEKYFGRIPKPTRKLDRTYTEEPPQDGERTVVLRRVGDVGIVDVVYHAPSGGHPDSAALDVLANILSSPPSGRLYKALVEAKKATRVSVGAANQHDPGVFEVSADVPKGDSLETARDIILNLVEKAGETPFTDVEVDRAKQQLLKQRELSEANTQQVALRMSSWAAQGDWRLYLLNRDRLEAVTPKDVQEVAHKYLRRENRTVGFFIPAEKSEKTQVPPTPDLAKLFEGYKGRAEIAAGEVFEATPANIDARTKRVKITDGVKAALLPKKTRGEEVSLTLALRFGTAESLKGYDTAADILGSLMMRGTKNLSRQQIHDLLDKNRATLTGSSNTGVARFTIHTKKQHLPAALDILRQVLREPSLPSEDFVLMQRSTVTNMEKQLTDPTALARNRLSRTLSPYPKDDVRYIPTLAEGIELQKAVTLDQVKKLYQDFLGAGAGEVVIIGDFNEEETLKLLGSMLSGWTSKQPYERITRKVFPDVAGGLQTILTPDKANAVYAAGQTFALKETDPDFAALRVGNNILGGNTLSSRLGDRIRQRDGLSYGATSSFSADALDARASLNVNVICNPENIEKVNKAVMEEINRLWSDGITDAELEKAKSSIAQAEQVRLTNDRNLETILMENLHTDRTMAYYTELNQRMAALTPKQVIETMKKYIDPKRFVVIDAGDFKTNSSAAR